MYSEMLEFSKNLLEEKNVHANKLDNFPFRKRFDHIERVFMWAGRLIEDIKDVNKEAVLTAAVFHDTGYAIAKDPSKHAESSAEICKKYLLDNNFDPEFIELVEYLVKNHSNKDLMTKSDTPMELIILMESDLLDETGALSVVWDCMMEGSSKIQTFEKTYNHIVKYSYGALQENPMVTAKAKGYWESKLKLVKEFKNQLSFDLGFQDNMF